VNVNEYICRSCYGKLYAPRQQCSICNSEGVIKKVIDGKNICQSCYNKLYRPKKICGVCGKETFVHKIDQGLDICPSCYNKQYRPKRLCSICGIEGYIEKHENGLDICTKCYNKSFSPLRSCHICNSVKKVHMKIDGKDICKICYEKYYRPKQICSKCGCNDTVAFKMEGANFCLNCYRKYYQPKRKCIKCGTTNIITKVIADGDICSSCYSKFYKPQKICIVCGLFKSTHKILNNDASVCSTCYQKYYQPKRKCSICLSNNKIARKLDGKDICRSCYEKQKGTCIKCNKITNNYFRTTNLCNDCWYTEKINVFIDSEKGNFESTEIFNLFDHYCRSLLAYRTPYRVMTIITRQIDIFKYISKNHINLVGFSLKQLNKVFTEVQCGEISQLTNFLIKEELIKETELYEEFIELRKKYLDKTKHGFANIYLSYTDYLIKKRETYVYKGWTNRFTWKTCSTYAYIAYFFINQISEIITSVNEITESIVEKYYLNNSEYMVSGLRPFIKWLNQNVRLFKKLPLPRASAAENYGGRPYTENEFMKLIDSLSKPGISYKEKLMGFLLLLYGIRPYELHILKLSDFKKVGEKLLVSVRGKSISMHTFIFELYDNYIRYEYCSKLSLGNATDWLFCGKKYNSPMSVNRICEILRNHNINSIRAFSTVVTNLLLTDSITPAIIIQGLGVSISTIANYYKALSLENIHEASMIDFNNKLNHTLKQSRKQYSKHYVYILKCCDGSYYTGYSTNLTSRIKQHQNGYGCTFTKTRTPAHLVYSEELLDKPSALKREKQIKKLTVFEKERLIEKSRVN
jgi:predicted GIY-YIG superfamily endonuclease/integrase